MKRRFRLYEIEHQGDESQAVSDLQRAGCTDVRVIARDYDGEESIAVEAVIPEGMTMTQLADAAEVCL